MSFFFEISIMTTPGATVSKTFAKALFNWCTTSLPASAAAAGTVDVGATSGCAANDVLIARHRVKMDMRIGWNLDSREHATFNWIRPIPVRHGESVLRRTYSKTASNLSRSSAGLLDEARIIGGTTLNMRAIKRRFVFRAGALVDVADKNGFTPLMAAAMNGNLAMFQLLLARSTNLHAEARCADARDLLGFALDGANPEIIRSVVERLPPMPQWKTSTRRALTAALQAGNKEQLRSLLRKHSTPPTPQVRNVAFRGY